MFNNNLIIFYFISLSLVISTSLVVFVNHIIFSLFFLVLSFIFTAILLLLFECEFLALMFVVIYVGAIAVLFLFVIMMLEVKLQNLSQNLIIYLITGLSFIIIFNVIFFKTVTYNLNLILINPNFFINWYEIIIFLNEIKAYSFVLYSHFVLQFLLTGFVLLVSLIGIIYFTKSFFNTKFRDQATFKQIAINSSFLN